MNRVYLSENANPILVDYLKAHGYDISFVYSTSHTYDPVSAHPDIYLSRMGFRKIFYGNPDLLGFHYPENVKYNAVFIGKYFIHNLESTSKDLLEQAKRLEKILVDVPQGYTKCNMVVVDDHSAITADLGIAKALEGLDIDLLVVTQGHVKLKGHPYGFLGGASGRVGDEMIFHGDLSAHPDFEKIIDFLKKHNCGVKYFPEFDLEDIGSIIWL